MYNKNNTVAGSGKKKKKISCASSKGENDKDKKPNDDDDEEGPLESEKYYKDDDDDEKVGLIARGKRRIRRLRQRAGGAGAGRAGGAPNRPVVTTCGSSGSKKKKDWLRPYWLGVGLFLVLFSFWILDSLKDPIFGALVGGNLDRHQPPAKLFSVCLTLALVCGLELVSAERERRWKRKQLLQQQPQRSDEDVLDGGGKWTKMDFGSNNPSSYDDYYYQDDDDESRGGRVPSSIFAYIGVPYCIGFGIMAYLLQFNPAVALSTTLSSTEAAAIHNGGGGFVDPTASGSASAGTYHGGGSVQSTFWLVLGYFVYAATESFGSIAVATFWSYVNSTLSLTEAESYYGSVIATAQLGAIAGSTMVTTRVWSNVTLIILACLIILLHVVVMTAYSRRFRPTDKTEEDDDDDDEGNALADAPKSPAPVPTKEPQDKRYPSLPQQEQEQVTTNDDGGEQGGEGGDGGVVIDSSQQQQQQQQQQHDEDESSLWSGVYLILEHNYVLLILGVSCLYEVSLTCLNYQMTLLGWSRFEDEKEGSAGTGGNDDVDSSNRMSFTQFMGHYGQMVNVTSLVLSSLAFPLLMRRAGLRRTLRLFPAMLLIANAVAFVALPGNLTVLFFSMSLLKAMTYSIHDPAKEILYLPTDDAIKFKAKFWIDVVGARIAKAVGSSINKYAGSVDRSIRVASAPSLFTAVALFYACWKAGRVFDRLVRNGHVVGVHEHCDDDDYDDDEHEIHFYDRELRRQQRRQRRIARGCGRGYLQLRAVVDEEGIADDDHHLDDGEISDATSTALIVHDGDHDNDDDDHHHQAR